MAQTLLLLTAPPASGKTFLIQSLIKQWREVPLLICPLRALANECLSRWGSECLVMTPEEWLNKKTSSKIVILDEFHLFYYWGDSFRPVMWEAFYEMVGEADLVILMTATLTLEMREEIKNFACHFDQLLWVDHGNQKLKYHPINYYKAYSENWLQEMIFTQRSNSGVSLIFCAYREEVARWEKRLKEKGFRVWSCVGGEAGLFSAMLTSQKPPDFIVATTVLSHGVNLPVISRIFLLYPVNNLDFWIQMVARGGRRGEAFEVFALENPSGIKWNKYLNALAILRLSLKMRAQQTLRQIEEWFLKA